MIYEKSCGAVVYTETAEGRRYLIEQMRQGHYAVCKGHVEGDETEEETAQREILEETGLAVKVDTAFREETAYSPYEGCRKQVIYFIARADRTETQVQPEEVRAILWLPFDEALKVMTYENDRQLLTKAEYYLNAVSVEEMRRRDAATIAAGTPGTVLMRRAAEGIFNAWNDWQNGTLILCGSGNNGGDGFSLAEILAEKGISCRVLTLGGKRTPDAAHYEKRAAAAGVPIEPYEAGMPLDAPLIVDCLLGTGFRGEVREPYASAIRAVNSAREQGCRVVSADINSGMNGDDGEGDLVVQSDLTVTIGLVKTGFFTPAGKAHYKELRLAEIGIR